MRRLLVQQWVTADSIVAEPDGGLGFVSGEPFAEGDSSPFRAEMMRFIDSVDTMLLGANTYHQSRDYWPRATDQGEYGQKLNTMTKLVASTTIDDAPWGDFSPATVTRDPVSAVRALKEQDGKDLWLWGSLRLMHDLQSAGVVDEYRLLVCPTTRGQGHRLFLDRHDLRLVEATAFDSGVVLVRYATLGPGRA